MKKVIGVRVTPKIIYYTILVSTEDGLEYYNEELIVPKSLEYPKALSYIRTTLASIITEYNINLAGIRIAEHISQNKSPFRIYIEGVIQELFSNSTVEKYYIGTIKSISSQLKISAGIIKEAHEGKVNPLEVENWERFNKHHRESFTTGLAAIYAETGGTL